MLKAKYKMHRFVNILFYGIVWLSGYLVGFGMKGVGFFENFKKIFINWFN